MAYVAGAEIAVDRLESGQMREFRREQGTDGFEQLVQRGAVANGHVVDLVDRVRVRAGGGEQVGLDDVVDVAEVAAGFAVAVDVHRLVVDHARHPLRHHRGVGAVRILAPAEDVEVPEADRLHAVAAAEHVGVQLVHQLGHRVRRQRLADDILDLGQAGMVAVGRARRRVDEALHPGVARRHQHVEEAGIVGGVGGERVFQRARHRAERGLVEHVVDARTDLVTGDEITDVAALEAEVLPALGTDAGLHLRQILFMAGGEVVQPDDALVEQEQGLDQVAADEAGGAGDEPGFRLGAKLRLQRVERGHYSLQSAKPAASTAAGSYADLTSVNAPPLLSRAVSSANGFSR